MNNVFENKEKTKNDIAWQRLFQEHSILEKIIKNGFFEIDAATINKVRESRLMAKFDHYINLPKIFKDNKISILPISRKQYIIGHFDTYSSVKYKNNLETTYVDFPSNIESIDCKNLSSESIALSCAFNTGIIDAVLGGEKAFYTISGRMSTGNFRFSIRNILESRPYEIYVDNSQCEIDGGFESASYLLIVEAKLYNVDSFLIRQLYYPYRLWSKKINKKVIPALMTYSNSSGMFSFFLYEFENDDNYNSIRLKEQKNYTISVEQIMQKDVFKIFNSVTVGSEPNNIPFPQANNFQKIVDLLTILLNKELTKEEITTKYQFDARQTNYYTDAARYLGLVNKYIDENTKEITFELTEEGKKILNGKYKFKILSLIRKILERQVFYKTLESTLVTGVIPSSDEISKVMSSCNLGLNKTTIFRRSSTVRGWLEWILNMISDEGI